MLVVKMRCTTYGRDFERWCRLLGRYGRAARRGSGAAVADLDI